MNTIARLISLNIIPSRYVPHGQRWVQGKDIYVNADNYESSFQTMTAEALLVALTYLQDMSRMQKSPVEQEEQR